jgi:two-component system OmpR family sensor kinase
LAEEKKTIFRFIVLYLVSVVFLVGIGEYFYYQLKYNSYIEKEKLILQNQAKIFMLNHSMLLRDIRFNNLKIKDTNIAIFVNKKLVYKNIDILKVNLDKIFWQKENVIYYNYLVSKKWLKVNIIFKKNIHNDYLKSIKIDLFYFNILIIVFVIILAYFLAKILIRPLKNMINSLQEFIIDATHEINTPIAIIVNNIEMLKYKNISFKEFDRIKNASFRIENIFKDLSYLKLNHQVSKIKQDLQFDKIILNRIKELKNIAYKKELKFEIDLKQVNIIANKEDIIKIIDNLLINSIKYTIKNEIIYIKLNKKRLVIKNKGYIKNLGKITNKFYRENKSEGGFGVGLYIVQKLSEVNDLEFNIYNEDGFIINKISL